MRGRPLRCETVILKDRFAVRIKTIALKYRYDLMDEYLHPALRAPLRERRISCYERYDFCNFNCMFFSVLKINFFPLLKCF